MIRALATGLIKREGEGILSSEQWLNYQATKDFIFFSWKANDEQPLRVFGDKLYPKDSCENIARELNKYLRTFPCRSLKSDGFKSSPEFSYIFYVKH